MDYPRISIPDQFRQTAATYAEQTLVVTPQKNYSFAEVDDASDRVAAALYREGVTKGDRIALYCINGPEFVIAYLGIQKAGATVVPVNLLIGAAEISYILNDAGVKGLIYHQAMNEKVLSFRGELEGTRCWTCIGESPVEEDDLMFSDWLAVEGDVPRPDFDIDEDIAAILYTSGTTGNPKGAMLTHHNLVANSFSVVSALQLYPGKDRLLVVLPMFHSFAATVGMLSPALHGLTIVPVPKFDPVLVSDMIKQGGATIFLGVPSMYGLMLRMHGDLGAKWKTIRFGVAGGAAMPVEVMQQFEKAYGFPILEGDGPTECSPVTCVNPLEGERKPASVGLPVPNVDMAIFDDNGQVIPDNEIGEICVQGPNVMKGYWNLPQETAETFFGTWLRTGDLGYKDDDGYIFMVDRKKDMIIVNGMNVYPRMIEEVLYQHEAIAEAAVIGEPHDSHGEIVVAHVVAKEGQELTAANVKEFCRNNLGQHQLPRKVHVRDSLPKNATGKILKRELRKEGELERGVDSR